MQKIALRCDVCNGPLTMQSGGQMAVCEYCGTRYALERLREKVQEIRGKVSVEGTVKTAYEDFEIHAGVLTKYHGADTEIIIPPNVKEIASGCFTVGRNLITSVALPDSLIEIGQGVFSGFVSLNQIALPNHLKCIGNNAFGSCTSLVEINIPDSVIGIGDNAFWNCTNLQNVIISSATYNRLCPQITEKKHVRSNMWGHDEYSNSTYSWQWSAFSSTLLLTFPKPTFFYGAGDNRIPFEDVLKATAPWFRQIAMQTYESIKEKSQKNWVQNNCCRHCGGPFEGVVFKMCRYCNKRKDY